MAATPSLHDDFRSSFQHALGCLRRAAGAGLQAAELEDLLKLAFNRRNQLEAAISGLIGALDQEIDANPAKKPLDLSCSDFLSHELKLSSSAAYAQVTLARQLPALPGLARAFERGELSPQHAGAVTRAMDMVARKGGDVQAAEDRMLDVALNQNLTAPDLFRKCLGIIHELAPQEFVSEEEERRERRYLHIRERHDGGATIEGYADPLSFSVLRTSLVAVMGKKARDDDRTPGQRRLDALVEIARRPLDSGELPARGGVKPHIMVSATASTLCGHEGSPAALLDWGFPISGRLLRQLAEDAEITPILYKDNGRDPLHVGRRYRTATPKMKQALAHRDQHCVWPHGPSGHCDRQPLDCQDHHIEAWASGGKTDIVNQVKLCGRHHGLVSRGWRLVRHPDGRVIVRPPEPAPPEHGPAIHDPPARAG